MKLFSSLDLVLCGACAAPAVVIVGNVCICRHSHQTKFVFWVAEQKRMHKRIGGITLKQRQAAEAAAAAAKHQ